MITRSGNRSIISVHPRIGNASDPLVDAFRIKHVSSDRLENRRFQQALSRINMQTGRDSKTRAKWNDIVETAKRSKKPGSYLLMIVSASKCDAEKAEEFLKVVGQSAKRRTLSASLPFDRKAERTETGVQRIVRNGVNAALETARKRRDRDNLIHTFGKDIAETLEENRLMVIKKKTNGKTVVACVNVEKVIPLETGGSAYIIYNVPRALVHLAGWVTENGKDVYVIDRALGEGNGDAKLTMRSRVSGTLQHELQHLLNRYFDFSRVDNEYSAYLAGFAFGRIANRHIKRMKNPDRRHHPAAQQALERIGTALVDLGVDMTHERNRSEIAKVCRGLLNAFYREQLGLSYNEIIEPFTV